MDAKMFEIRDRATFLPMICVRLSTANLEETYLLKRTGWGDDISGQVFMFHPFGGDEADYEYHDRTRRIAHDYIKKNWLLLKTGAVIDVEFILGETKEPKISERHTDGI